MTARAGTKTPWSTGTSIDGTQALSDQDWDAGPVQVGQYDPNPWGFRDMHDNVWEWCQDIRGPYSEHAPRPGDGLRVPSGTDFNYRVIRGGGFYDPAQDTRSTLRLAAGQTYTNRAFGVRAARSITE